MTENKEKMLEIERYELRCETRSHISTKGFE